MGGTRLLISEKKIRRYTLKMSLVWGGIIVSAAFVGAMVGTYLRTGSLRWW